MSILTNEPKRLTYALSFNYTAAIIHVKSRYAKQALSK